MYKKGEDTMKIIKKNGLPVDFDGNKIKVAIRKSAERAMVQLTEEQENEVVTIVLGNCLGYHVN